MPADRFARIADAMLRHRHFLARVENATVRALLGPLQAVLEEAVERLQDLAESAAARRQVLELAAEITGQLVRAYRQLGQTVPSSLAAIAAAEAAFDFGLSQRALGGGVTLGTVQLERLAATGWRASLSRQAADAANALRASVSLALAGGEGAAGVASRFGRAAYLATSAAEGMTREAIAETVTAVDVHVIGLMDEDDAVPMWLSTLDDVTCLECAVNDGRVLEEIGDEPPAHRNCRCVVVPWERGLPRTMRERAAEPGGRVHVRDYSSWFNRQSAAFQREALGPSRYALFKKGKLPLRSFVDDGDTLTLAELAQRHEQIFAELFDE
jgi:hypothetical protein